ncbi:MAG: SGNH/GDSL hydrolase family protein [Lachnospiraceae bacterium]|nr:SGNH/GDSL hydrolase family protein [Lachnospiraceae bacterium]
MKDKTLIKRIPVIIIKVLLIILLVYLLNRLFTPKYETENLDGRITREYYKEKLDTDIIFVGSSTVYSGISPMVLWQEKGYTSYDRSNASQTIWTSYYMIEDAIKYRKPELVVLDVGFIKYDDDFCEEPSNRKAIDGMRLSRSKIDLIKAASGKDEKLSEYLFPVLRFHTRWKELTSEDFLYTFYDRDVTYNGFLFDFRETETLPAHDGYAHGDEVVISPKNLEYLNKTIELCRDNDVELFLMKVPSYSDNWSLGYDRRIGEIASNSGIDYVNFDPYSDEMGIDYRKHSPDEGSHLNTTGAEIFTSYLGDYIKDHYDITSHSNDPKYEKVWEKKLVRYENDKKTVKGRQ